MLRPLLFRVTLTGFKKLHPDRRCQIREESLPAVFYAVTICELQKRVAWKTCLDGFLAGAGSAVYVPARNDKVLEDAAALH